VVASPNRSTALDIGLLAALTTAIAVLGLIGVSAKWPEALWHSSLGDSQILVAAIGTIVAIVLGLVFVRASRTGLTISALVITAVIYAVFPATTYFRASDAENRQARKVAGEWPLVVNQDYEHPGFFVPEPYQNEFGNGRAEVRHGRLVLIVESNRDFTYQVGVSRRPASVADFYARADVELLDGPAGSYCGVLFRWRDREHWLAFKLSGTGFQVTQNPGHLPHRLIMGSVTDPRVNPRGPNTLELMAHGSRVQLFVNRHLVDDLDIQDFDGQVWLAAQAAREASILNCAFDNIEQRAPAVQ
jgi:hypothetical protein